jgi:hypothetical protein
MVALMAAVFAAVGIGLVITVISAAILRKKKAKVRIAKIVGKGV